MRCRGLRGGEKIRRGVGVDGQVVGLGGGVLRGKVDGDCFFKLPVGGLKGGGSLEGKI